jgi:L-ascorbate metabolism protein UlaG (beta-lactamase superfamily)
MLFELCQGLLSSISCDRITTLLIPFSAMHLSWLGQTCLKLQTKQLDEDVLILFDAYKPEKGDFPRSFSPQVALFSHGEEDNATLSQDPFIVSTLGEFDIKGVLISAWPGPNGTIIFKVAAEGMTLVHLGNCTEKLSSDLVDKLGKIDILALPVGGEKKYLTPSMAAEILNELEPRVVIPMGYRSDSDPEAKPIEDFIKESGLKPALTDKKVILKQKDLPQEETRLLILEKNI